MVEISFNNFNVPSLSEDGSLQISDPNVPSPNSPTPPISPPTGAADNIMFGFFGIAGWQAFEQHKSHLNGNLQSFTEEMKTEIEDFISEINTATDKAIVTAHFTYSSSPIDLKEALELHEANRVQAITNLLSKYNKMLKGAWANDVVTTIGDINCFPAGTPILTSSGETIAIEFVKTGMQISSFSQFERFGQGDLVAKNVTKVFTNVTQVFLKIEFDDGREPLFVTPNHLFLDEAGSFTKISSLLKLGGNTARIIDQSGLIVAVKGSEIAYSAETANLFEVVSERTLTVNGNTVFKENVLEGWKTYNFEVSDHHTYVAGGVRVHNDSIGNFTINDLGRVTSYTNLTTGVEHDVSNPNGYTADFLEHYATEDSTGTATASFSSTARAIADFLGLDGSKFGVIDGTSAKGGEGVGDVNAPEAHDPAHDHSDPGPKPIIIDLDGDGVEITFGESTFFDFDDDGYIEQTSWVAPDDGFLVIDLQADGTRTQNADGTHGDGEIDQAREIAFALWGADGVTDLQALAEAVDENDDKIFDSNGDHKLTEADDVWDELRIWQDANSNGIVDTDELMTLDLAASLSTGLDQVKIVNIEIDSNGDESPQTLTGITEINLIYDDKTVADPGYDDETDDITVFGNTQHGLASIIAGNNVTITGAVGDVLLSYNSLGWKVVGTQDTDGEYIGDWYVEFEEGDRFDYHNLVAADGAADVNLLGLWLDGATGNDFANTLSAIDATKSVAISGRGGADTINGGNNDDMLSGDKGADEINGRAGNDVLFVDAADTLVKGGSGYDTVIAVDYEEVDSNGEAIIPDGITLDLYNATASASADIEAAYGNSGDDTLDASDAPWAVALYGGGGVDVLTGGLSGDILSGDDGNDTVTASEGDDFVTGGSGDDNLKGNDGDDFIMGGEGFDDIFGGLGDDFILAGDNADTIEAGNGDDYVAGDKGHDSIDGGSGDDRLYGGLDHDTLADGAGDDHLEGGMGDDQFVMSAVSGTSSYDVVFGGKGVDTIKLNGARSDWTWASVFYVDTQITGYVGPGNDPVYESTDRGIQQYLLTNGKAVIEIQDVEVLDFETGTDKVFSVVASDVDNSDSYYRSNTGYTADTMLSHINWLAGNGDDTALSSVTHDYTGTPQGSYETYYYAAGDDTFAGLAGNDALSAGTGNDLLKGGAGSDVLSGDAGNDTLNGSTGSDAIFGGDGLDTINGASGSDRIDGGAGNDSISGGSGGDYISGGLGDDNISGGSGSDLIGGEEGNDTIIGDGGDDRLYGGDGDDILDGGISNDSLYGGIGLDTLKGDYGDDLLVGGEGADELFGGHGFDLLYGGDDADLMEGGAFDDVLYGGAGDDTLQGDEGADFLEGGAGADTLRGGDGWLDVASYASSDAAVTVELLLDGTTAGTGTGGHAEGDTLISIESLLGSRYADNLTGNNLSNTLSGGAGHDTLNSGDGNDYVYGGAGADSLNGGDGIDRLYGGFEADILDGGAGDDQLFGGIEDETQKTVSLNITNGSFAADTIAVGAIAGLATGWTLVSGIVTTRNAAESWFTTGSMNGSDRNYVWLDENAGIKQNISTGISADERFTVAVDVGKQNNWAFSSSYKIELRIGGVVVKDFEGTVQNDNTFETVYISLNGGALEDTQTGQAITLTISSTNDAQLAIDNVRAISDDDTLSGGVGSDELYGGIGEDTLNGGAGADTLFGGLGNDSLYSDTATTHAFANDTLYGGDGNDLLVGSNGTDSLYGDEGNDTLYGGHDYTTADRDFLYGGAGNDALISNFVGGSNLDRGDALFGGEGNDTLTGGDAHDTLSGGKGNDKLYGGNGNDTIYVAETTNQTSKWGTDTAYGGNGNDQIIGGNSTSFLYGDAGDDVLNGGDDWRTADVDKLYGGNGNDTLISGFVGADRDIDLHKGDELFGGAGADTLTGGNAHDILNGGAGADVLYGGAGNDSLYSDTATTHAAASDTLYGGDGNDLLVGSNTKDTLYGDDGNDTLYGGNDYTTSDKDKLYGGNGNDTLISNFVGGDYLNNGDALFGGNGADTLTGGDAHDTLSGGAGNDVITGGSGADTFIFQANHGADVITDFQDNLDKIDLSNLGVTWAGKGTSWSITSNGGNAKIIYDGADNVVLTGIAAAVLTESDFIF